MYKRYIAPIILILSMMFAALSSAQAQSTLNYFTLEPDITTNFTTIGKKLGYIQVRIDIMVNDSENLALVEHHQPLIRNAIIELLGTQSEASIKSLAGREDIRNTLVEQLNEALLPETGKMIITDLLFTKYLYQ
ncbi:flagellar basal body-associated protein FliL [Vibrio sp. 10N.286.49.B3]|uniref:flagellar basal body-associated protein FliL n=1 Tax=Vibrio sp. 10N.286.49.B3 TaxID=1880855 RepID=UPI000C85272B|nr:flagellar basal body-associated protein FliL [Vibrio sp. 10N.286.49.B3]PMH45430.1 flagellar basal body-associated protein FliL [Vibrio sp. 10N.286.49.B3]